MGTDDSSPLRVAFDVGPLYGHRTGVGEAVAGMLAELERRPSFEPVPYLVSYRSRPEPGHRKLPVPGIAASWLWSRTNHPRADRWLTEVDLVHGTNYVAPPTALPTVVSVYDCWFLAHPDQASPLVRRAGRQLRRAVERGAWVHTSSEATAVGVRELLGTDRVVAIHLGPPAPLPGTAETPAAARPFAGRPFILVIGSEERRKGLPLLVAAFGELTAADPVLVLAGARGDDTAAVDAAIASLPGDGVDRVHRLGIVDEATKAWLLRHASVLAYPSLDEGFGFPVLEAQSAGTPVVATDVGSIREVAGDGAVLVDERSPDRFAEALDAVLTGRVGRLGLIEAGHRNVHRFSWERTVDRLAELYRTVRESAE